MIAGFRREVSALRRRAVSARLHPTRQRDEGDIGVFVVGVAARPSESAFESALVAKLIGGLYGVPPMIAAYSSSASANSR